CVNAWANSASIHGRQNLSLPTSLCAQRNDICRAGPGANARRAMIRVLVVDDHDIVRDALASLLGDVSDFEVVGVASSIRDALPLLDSARPDIVLADLSLGDGSAVELVRALRRGKLKGRVIVITGFSDEFAAAEALTAGANGYVLKSQPTVELLE